VGLRCPSWWSAACCLHMVACNRQLPAAQSSVHLGPACVHLGPDIVTKATQRAYVVGAVLHNRRVPTERSAPRRSACCHQAHS
jgi:hypothetical protein